MGFLSFLSILWLSAAMPTDTTYQLQEVEVVASLKQNSDLRTEPLASTSMTLSALEGNKIGSLSEFALRVPNLMIPDYGSKMTSSIYVRGLGSRIDNPAMGLYVDQVPYFNKNGFDVDLWDVQRIEMLRGPQSTLYGRNTIGGLMLITTLSPLTYEGTRLSLGYGNGNSYQLRASTYLRFSPKVGFSIGSSFNSTDGFFRNNFTGRMCDWERSGNGRMRVVWQPSSRWTLDNTLHFGRSIEGGYTYAAYDPQTQTLAPIAYNDLCGYERTLLTEGLSLRYRGDRVLLSSVTSWQYLNDRMRLDQDFTPRSMFTMVQAQQEHTLSQEVTLHRADPSRRWQWLSGVALFYKHTNMGAPVHFKQDGIEDLILSNINKGIHTVFPDADILFREQEFDILSDFRMPVFGAALYHQSQYRVGRFTFTAGLRLDYERASLHYDSRSGLGYRFTLTMKEFRDFTSELTGVEHRNFFEPLPKLALQYDLPRNGNLYLAITKGYKSGGYNTQIFSDILQNKMQVDMMKDLGITFEDGGLASYRVGEVITYDPEYSWNFEVGAHLDFWESRLRVDADLFLIECRDQQLTVFPSGKSTGRMMTNAGRTRSYGAEVALDVALTPALHLYGSYGYTHATFTQYHDGRTDYAGRWVPYVPRHTVGLGADYTLAIRSKALDQIILRLNYSGLGPIFWNEANTLQESFYSLLGGSLSFVRRGVRLDIWSRNLTNTAYNTFYFMSIGNSFLSQGKPRQYGVTLNWVF